MYIFGTLLGENYENISQSSLNKHENTIVGVFFSFVLKKSRLQQCASADVDHHIGPGPGD